MKHCRFIHIVIGDGYKLAYTGTDTNLYRGSRKYRELSCLTAVAYYNYSGRSLFEISFRTLALLTQNCGDVSWILKVNASLYRIPFQIPWNP